MIRKLQNRFVRIAVLVLTAAMVTVVGIINTANLIIVRSELAGRAAIAPSPAGSRKKATGAG